MTENVAILMPAEERPLPLVRASLPVAEFPTDALGDILGGAASAIHEIVQSPLPICGQSVLAAATLATQGHADIELPTGQIKPISNFFLTIASSGERKTATDGWALSPIRKHEDFLDEDYRAKLPGYRNEKAAWDAARKHATSAHKGNFAAIRDALDKLGPEPAAPLHPMMTCPEPTFEGLTLALQTGQPSMGIFSAEGGQFIGGHGMSEENKLASAAAYSSAWDGEAIKRVRAKDGVTVLKGRRLSAHLMVQPEVADLMLGDALLKDQGLLSRFLVTSPKTRAGKRFFKDPSPASRTKLATYETRMYEILQRPWSCADGVPNELSPPILRLSRDARTLFINFADDVERQLGPQGEMQAISGLANKLPEHASRLAAVLTTFEEPNAHEIQAEQMLRGIKLAQYYAAEALRLTQTAQLDQELRLGTLLLEWLPSWDDANISLRDIYQLGPNAIRDRKTAMRAAAILEAHRYLVKLPKGSLVKGERRREAWRIVPS